MEGGTKEKQGKRYKVAVKNHNMNIKYTNLQVSMCSAIDVCNK